MDPDEKVPAFDRYVEFESVGFGGIQFVYRNDQGEEVRRSVTITSPQFKQIQRDMDLFNLVKAGEKAGYELINGLDPNANLLDAIYVEPDFLADAEGKALAIEYTDGEGLRRKGFVHADINKEDFERVKTGKERKQLIIDNASEGYSLIRWDKDLPSFAQYTNFSDPGEQKRGGDDGIAFEYIDKNGKLKKGLVLRSVDEELFKKVEADRELFRSQKNWLDQQNAGLDSSDPRFVTVAAPGNYWKKVVVDGNVTYEKTDSYEVDQIAWMEVEAVPELGEDVLLVTTYDSDRRDNVVRRQLVHREDIGDEKFNRLQDDMNHSRYVNFFQSRGTRPPSSTHPERNIRVWTKDKFKSSELGDVSRVVTDFIDKGFVLLEFNDSGSGPYVGQTILISENETPEAFDIARKFALGDDRTKINLLSLEDGEDWIKLRDNREFSDE
ncbi:hypothetical protein GCM10007276_32560 [Agaricicola taiwanensis]|uniref:Uncharacterized protein n=2 Tax=Agaricicola taiwanensis TaxID=591372 RepID=A0A8J2YLY4_9RHOB|nr:hypothetical protein GCM10007276_32560 [Agaricicola taiwanensis]